MILFNFRKKFLFFTILGSIFQQKTGMQKTLKFMKWLPKVWLPAPKCCLSQRQVHSQLKKKIILYIQLNKPLMMRLKLQVGYSYNLQCIIRFKMSKVNLTSGSLHVKILNSANFQFKTPKITAYCSLV